MSDSIHYIALRINKFYRENRKFVVLFIICISIRFININMPILEGTATRQVQTAMVARNFCQEEFNILYPRADHYGAGTNYLILEFPLLNALTAIGYKVLGGVYEWIGRFWSISFFSGGLIFLYLFVKEIFDKDTAYWTGFVFSFSPLSIIFSRTFMPDFEMLFFCLGGLYFMYLYTKTESIRYFWLSSFFSMFALLVKVHSFYIALPLAYLLFIREKGRILLHIRNWLYMLIFILPAALWYIRASHIQHTFNPHEAYNFNILYWMRLSEFFSVDLYKNLINIYSGIFLTPIGLTFFIIGLFLRTRTKENILWVWLCGVILFIIAFVSHIHDPYYNLNALPVASIFIARVIVSFKGYEWECITYLNGKVAKTIFLVIVFLFVLRYALYAYHVPKGYKYIPEAGKAIQSISKQDDLIIASSAGSPAALYYCDRKGRPFLLPGADELKTRKAIDKLEAIREEGAKFFLSAVMNEFNGSVGFKKYMLKKYEIVKHKKGKYIIFRLN